VAAYSLWYNVVRPVAVGTMLVAAANTMFCMRKSLAQSLAGSLRKPQPTLMSSGDDPTEKDIPARLVILGIVVLFIPIVAIYYWFTGGWTAAIVSALLMTGTGFLLSAVGGYLCGLVGCSNQPVSGLTLAALVLSALLLLAIGVTGAAGVAAVLGVAAVVACACSVSGSLIQDLKAGHLLGGTPWKMQVVEILAVVLLAFFLMAPIIALHEANLDTGGIGGRALPAPQAGLMAQLAKGIVGGQMAWGLLGMGAAFGIALILCGARAPMLIAVGMYLPFDTSAAIFLGGLLKWVVQSSVSAAGEDAKRAMEEKGMLLASGLVAGEAIMGIGLSVLFMAGVPSLAMWLTGSDTLPFAERWGGWLSLIGFAGLVWVLVRIPLRR
jgi:putative OPT family oligopeptide transporter